MIDTQRDIARQQFDHQSWGSLKRRDVMSPLNWFGCIVEACLILGAVYVTALWLKIVLTLMAALLLFFYAAVYCYWALKDPNRLQSEEYNLAHRAMGLMDGRDTTANDAALISAVRQSGTISLEAGATPNGLPEK